MSPLPSKQFARRLQEISRNVNFFFNLSAVLLGAATDCGRFTDCAALRRGSENGTGSGHGCPVPVPFSEKQTGMDARRL
jgi:hypothetical protein